MKKIYLFISAVSIFIVASSSIAIKSSTGIAGFSGAPGTPPQTCGFSGCHSGGSSASSGMTITTTPALVNDQFKHDSVYRINISATAAGFTRFGLDCEVLTPTQGNAGTLTASLSSGVKLMQFGARTNAVHISFKTGTVVTWSFPWKAPSAGTNTAIIYAAANAVNGDGSTTGDFPIPPVSRTLTAVEPATVTAISSTSPVLKAVSVYPNPATVFAQVRVDLPHAAELGFAVTDLNGRLLLERPARTLPAGAHAEALDLRSFEPGVYFVQITAGGDKLARKMLIVH